MQKGRGGPVRHARVAVGRARCNALEQPEHAPYIPDPVERRDEVHLRGARVGEADLHPRAGQRLDQAICSVHLFITPLCSRRFGLPFSVKCALSMAREVPFAHITVVASSSMRVSASLNYSIYHQIMSARFSGWAR